MWVRAKAGVYAGERAEVAGEAIGNDRRAETAEILGIGVAINNQCIHLRRESRHDVPKQRLTVEGDEGFVAAHAARAAAGEDETDESRGSHAAIIGGGDDKTKWDYLPLPQGGRKILMRVGNDSHLRHLREPRLTRVRLEIFVVPEKCAGHGGGGYEHVEQRSPDDLVR